MVTWSLWPSFPLLVSCIRVVGPLWLLYIWGAAPVWQLPCRSGQAERSKATIGVAPREIIRLQRLPALYCPRACGFILSLNRFISSGMVVPEPLGVFLPLLNNGSWGLGTPGPAQYSALLPVGQKDFVRSYWKLIHWGAGVGPFSCRREVGAWRVGL